MAKTVLIVEDNELNMKLFHDLLDAHGYRTVQTRSGLDALALARQHRPDGSKTMMSCAIFPSLPSRPSR
jgi:two-component system, cell cycle response regulator DivK